MSERIKTIRKDITELDQYARRNKESIEKLKEQYEKAVNINECFIDRIRAMEKELFDLERGMCGIHHSECINRWFDDEE